MPNSTRGALLGALLATTLLLGACGSDDPDVETGAGATTTTSPDTQSVGPVTDDPDASGAITWAPIEPTDDLVNPTVATPDELIADPDDDTVVLIHFYGGVQDCYGSRATVVTQDDATVEIRLETGSQPDAGDTACIEIAEAQELSVTLDEPLGDRTLTAATA